MFENAAETNPAHPFDPKPRQRGKMTHFVFLRQLGAATALVAAMSSAQAFDAVDSPPLADLSDTAIRDCRPGNELTVPLITWGADIVTIHANNNSASASRSGAFGDAGLSVDLVRQDDFTGQLRGYMACESPFLRATVGMANLAVELTNADPRTRMIAIYQHSWSAGGDALVVGSGIEKPADLKGKRVAVQRYGPHIDYLLTILTDAGLTPDDIDIVWTEDLTGLSASSPDTALLEGAADAAMVIIPDALALTSGGSVGTGSEGSLKGAKILLSTKTANRVIADAYFVRADFLEAAPDTVNAFVEALIASEAEVREIARQQDKRSTDLFTAAAGILLDDASAVADAQALWADAETVGENGNIQFFRDPAYQRRFSRLNESIQPKYIALGMLGKVQEIAGPPQTLSAIGDATTQAAQARFDETAVAKTVTKLQAQGGLDDGTLFQFELNFKPNQSDFPIALYREPFLKAIDLSATYGGALITIEGHADPLGYLKKQKDGADELVLSRIAQSAKNLSYNRAGKVRSGLIELAETEGFYMDPSQFALVGHGFSEPKTGLCENTLPCAPKTKEEWLSNMRVVLRIVQVEAESDVFIALD